MRRYLVSCVLGLVAAACSEGAGGGALKIRVVLGPDSLSSCVIVGVRKADADTFVQTPPIARPPSGRDVIVAVAKSSTLGGLVIPYARGFQSPTCDEPSIEETTAEESFNLDHVGVLQQATLTLTLTTAVATVDGGSAGGGGGAGGAGGGSGPPDAGSPEPFGYSPSNFKPADIPAASIASAGVFPADCSATFDSTTNTFSSDSGLGSWCGQPLPIPFDLIQDGGIPTVVLAMQGLTLPPTATLNLVGARPVILAIFGTANIEGAIDARSVGNVRLGAGANWLGCGTILMMGQDASGSSGGGGAAFGTAGSSGAGPGGGDAGIPGRNEDLFPLHGGCEGGRGSDSQNGARAAGGWGGGAVQISAASGLSISGLISTSGSGGRGGLIDTEQNGGGGAGSGGAILLEAVALEVKPKAILTCNGGGGGGGRQNNVGTGSPGEDGAPDSTIPAAGGLGGNPIAGRGASGAAGTTPAGTAPATAGTNSGPGGPAGSGAGGGGLGRIRLNALTRCEVSDAAVLSAAVSKPLPCKQ